MIITMAEQHWHDHETEHTTLYGQLVCPTNCHYAGKDRLWETDIDELKECVAAARHLRPTKHTRSQCLTARFDPRPAEEQQPDLVNHPPHYTGNANGVECIDVVEDLGFCIGNAIKYLWRADEKDNALQDLQKARWYIDREINRRERRQSGDSGK